MSHNTQGLRIVEGHGLIRKICVELIKSGITFESLENINDDVVNNIQIWQSTEVHEGLVGKAFADGYSHLKTVYEQMLKESDKRCGTGDYHVGHALRKTALLDKTTIRRIQKLGDYCGAARVVTDAMNLPSIHDLRASIRFTELILPQPTQHSMADNFLQTINAFADSIQSVLISWDELKRAYPSLGDKEEPTGDTAVAVSTHCECTMY
ncbi:hypothetical protein V8E54_011837 [Elaphomyces granulatus]